MNDMEIEGKIIKALPVRSGISSKNNEPWRIATFVLETIERYPQRMVFDVSDGRDNRITRLNIKEGGVYRIFFSLEVSEFEGKWYNRINAWDARAVTNFVSNGNN